MTPEKNSKSIVNLPPKVKKAIAGGIVVASLVTGCNALNGASISEKPVVTLTSIPTKDAETNADQTQATYELAPTPKATETMINPPASTLTPEPTVTESLASPEVVTEAQKWRTIIESIEGVNNIVLAPEQVFSDFFNKNIPIEENLRVGKDNLIKDIGGYEIDESEVYSDIANVQLLMMGGYINNDGLFLMVGTQDMDGNRIILPVQITFGKTGALTNSMVILDGNEIKKISLPAVGLNSMSTEEILSYAKKNVGEVVVIQFMLDIKERSVSPRPEFIEIDKKSSIVQRLEVNNIFCKKPEELKINDLNDLKEIPWGQLIVFSN